MSEVEFEAMKLERLCLIVGEGKAQADSGEFAVDGSLEGLLAELDGERDQKKIMAQNDFLTPAASRARC